MIVCNRCGKENQDHYKFCLGCGAELTASGKSGGDVAMMKTMMQDASGLLPLPRPVGLPGVGPAPGPLPGVPSPAPGYGNPPGSSPGMPNVGSGAAHGLPPIGQAPHPSYGAVPSPLGAPLPGMGHGAGPLGAPLPTPGSNPAMNPLGVGPGGLGMGHPAPTGGLPEGDGTYPGPSHMAARTGASSPNLASPPMGMGAPPMGMPPSAGPPAGPPPGVPGATPMAFPNPAQASTSPRRCPQCGADVPPGFRFCGACGCRMDELSQPSMPAARPAPRPQPRAVLTLIRPDGSEGGTHELRQGENKIGRNFGSLFESDGYLSPVHADLIVNLTTATVRDLESLNGVFVKMTEEEEIHRGQVLRIGQELLRLELIDPPEPIADGTEVMGSPNPGYWGKITVIIGRNVDGASYPLIGDSITLGRERGEINFPDDGYVSGLHARISLRDDRVFLADLGSSNGTFVKVSGERALVNDSFVLMGQQLFRINLSAG